MKTFFDVKNGISVKLSYCGEHIAFVDVVVRNASTSVSSLSFAKQGLTGKKREKGSKAIEESRVLPLLIRATQVHPLHPRTTTFCSRAFLVIHEGSRNYIRSLRSFQECSKKYYLNQKVI